MKVSLAFAGAAMAAVTLAACGGGDSQYCTDLEAANSTLQDFEEGDVAALEEGFQTMHDLAGVAPEAVAADWEVLDGMLTDAESAMDGAGITFDDLAAIQSGELPEGVDAAALQEIATTFTALDSEEVDNATEAIEDHAESECGVDLSS